MCWRPAEATATNSIAPASSHESVNNESFRSSLLDWYDANKREMPWRGIDDPYRTWVSEIMLQQTRVDQATPYYERFIRRFPTVEELAAADRQDVLRVWEGLGYYRRARHLHEAARTVVEEFGGEVPGEWDQITRLKGIGPYTASAVLSIAFGRPHAVVDGNVLRVLTRYYGIDEDIRRSAVKNRVQELADELIDSKRPGDFNQAVMELGATVCTPSGPECGACPLQAGCQAARTARQDEIPYKSPPNKRPHHQIGVGVIRDGEERVLIALRPEDAMLGGLWEFPGGKREEGEELEETVRRELREELGVEVTVDKPLMKVDHAYSHLTVTLNVFLCSLDSGTPSARDSQEVRWVTLDELDEYPFPKANRAITEKLQNTGRGQHELEF